MRNNKNKWSFYNLPTRRELTAEEVAYWKNSLKKILKIGMEFEYNLPEKKNGQCKSNSDVCPCVNLTTDNTCWQECAKKDNCEIIESFKNLKNCPNKTDTCEEGDCTSCTIFSYECPGLNCTGFITKCLSCNDYKVNCEKCEYRFDPKKSPEYIRKDLVSELKPTSTYGLINSSGVHSITTDGSLKGQKGAEIITVGRRIDYWEFYKMSKNIIESAINRGAYLNERCSLHMHALASYYGKSINIGTNDSSIPDSVKEMERDMPEIILANLHQLVRRYQNAMTWMVMGLDDQDRMTRWEKFRISIIPISSVIDHMSIVKDKVANHAGGNKYSWINYNQVKFESKSGDINRFHVEFRAADGLNSPSAVSAIACMYYALIIKAVEISRYGVVEVGNDEWVRRTEEVKEVLLNNTKGYQDGDRFSDTKHLHRYYDILIGEAMDLVRQLKAILIKIGPAYEVLEKLAERPCALRRVQGDTWQQIENDLKVIVNEEGVFERELNEIITLNQVTECANLDEWVDTVNNIMNEDIEFKAQKKENYVGKIKDYVTRKDEDGELIWAKRLGAPIFI